GSVAAPWQSWAKARTMLRPGDTLYHRGGVYFMYNMNGWSTNGAPGNEIKLLAYPGDPEPVIITTAHPALYLDPATAWEPVVNGRFAKDLFGGAAGAELSTRTGEYATWEQQSPFTANAVLTDEGRVRAAHDVTSDPFYVLQEEADSPAYDIIAPIYVKSPGID